jgi:leucyl/phenylalanyl-tRNA--protein transferase
MPIPLFNDVAFLAEVPTMIGPEAEFAAMRPVTAETVAAVCSHGYIPMGLGSGYPDVMLVKCHRRRCVLAPGEARVAKSTARRARGLTVAVNRDFGGTIRAVSAAHEDSWFTPALIRACESLHKRPAGGIRFISVEVYRGSSRVAGEIGYRAGAAYTSLSGYHSETGTGSVQLAALAELLYREGLAMWDLGMEIEYKLRLGAIPVARNAFLSRYRELSRQGDATRPVGVTPGETLDAHTLVSCARRRGVDR